MRVLLVLSFVVAAAANAEEFSGTVMRVVDGDSLMVQLHGRQVRVRLKEIDAPELKQPFGEESQQSLAQICAKKSARVLWTAGTVMGAHWGPCMVRSG